MKKKLITLARRACSSVLFVFAWVFSWAGSACMRCGKWIAPVSCLFVLTACNDTRPVPPEVIEKRVLVMVPVPGELTQETPSPNLPLGKLLNRHLTDYGSALRAALQSCNADKAAIRNLQPKE